MLKRSICAMFSSCLVLAVGCGNGSTDPVVSGVGGASSNGGSAVIGSGGAISSSSSTGGTTAASSGGAIPGTGGTVTNTGGASAQGGVATAATGGATPLGGTSSTAGKATGGSTSTGGSANATGGARPTGGTSAATAGASATGGASAATGGASAAGGTTVDSSGCRVWLATNGNDTNAGTQAAPVATLLHAYDLVCPLVTGSVAGDECGGPSPRTVCVKTGTYPMPKRFEFKKTRMGTATKRIIVQADPSSTTKPVFDFTTQPRVTACNEDPSTDDNFGGFTINADYVTLKNIEISNANDNCIKVQGAYGVLEGVVVHHCTDAGIQLSSSSGYTGSGTNNSVINCDSYLNFDSLCGGENADGFAAKEGTGTGNVFRGCRSWDNTDDGWDLFAWASPITVDNCWAVSQTKTNKGTKSDGNGFKLGGNNISAAHILKDLVAVDNNYGSSANGFTENSNPASMSCTGACYSWGNKTNVDTIGGTISSTAPNGATAASMIAAAARNGDGSLKSITAL